MRRMWGRPAGAGEVDAGGGGAADAGGGVRAPVTLFEAPAVRVECGHRCLWIPLEQIARSCTVPPSPPPLWGSMNINRTAVSVVCACSLAEADCRHIA